MIGGANGSQDPRFGGQVGAPIVPIEKDQKDLAPAVDLTAFKQRYNMMRLEALSKWYPRWRQLSRYINPQRGFFEGFVPNYNAQYDQKLVIDDNPAHYSRIMAAGMSSGMTPASLPWLKLGVGDPELERNNDDAKGWLEFVARVLYDIAGRSNTYDAFQNCYEETGLFGTGSFGIFEDYHTVIRCRSYTIGEYYLSTDFAGRINGFARQYWLTVDQMVQEFGWKNVSTQVQASYNAGNRDVWVLVYTLCEENTSRVPGVLDFKGMKYRSVTWEAQAPDQKALRVSGYHEWPYPSPRWDMTTTADVYGNGPGWFAFGNVKMLYRMQKDSLLAINKVADPPVLVDASVEGQANMLPGGVTRVSSAVPNAGVRAAYEVRPDIEGLEAKIEKTDRKIASRFYADLFAMLHTLDQEGRITDKTAMEIAAKEREKLSLLGPVLGRVKSDMLDPGVHRTFGIALRAGLIPRPPRVLQGRELIPEYISVLAQAQKAVATGAIEQTVAFVGSMSASYPEAKDVIDADEAVREYATLIGTPSKMVKSRESVDALRGARAEQAAQAQAKVDAGEAVKAAELLSKTQVGAGNALEGLLNVPPAGPGAGAVAP